MLCILVLFFLLPPRPLSSTLFPYTTLFRSLFRDWVVAQRIVGEDGVVFSAQLRQTSCEVTGRQILNHVAASLGDKGERVLLRVKILERRAEGRLGQLSKIGHLRQDSHSRAAVGFEMAQD